jgi:DNA polymerase phi
MSTILPLFWHLSSASRDERLDASTKLVCSLTQFQDQFKADMQTDSDSDEGTKDELEKYNAPDVTYAIRRLVRGLASPRESSRLGFAVVLTEVGLCFGANPLADLHAPSSY